MSLSIADYAVLAFYFVFMMAMGWVFKRFIKDTSDYPPSMKCHHGRRLDEACADCDNALDSDLSEAEWA